MRRVLIDTSAVFALAVRNDKNHLAARDFLADWLKQQGGFVLPDVIFNESMTLLKSRLGGQMAIRVGREMRRNPLYLWTALEAAGELDTWAAFQRYDDKEWSYTDCALLVLTRRLKISEIFAFDQHFGQMPEVTRLP